MALWADCGFSAVGLRGRTDGVPDASGNASSMRTSYGVVWREGEGGLARGKLELLPRVVRLDGVLGDDPVTSEIPYEYLAEIRIGRSATERIDGRPSLVLVPRAGSSLAIASVAQSGVIAEIAERLAALQLGTEGRRRVAIVLPLRPESRDAVRTLLADGPPFDPQLLGLDRHDVYLTATEAIFIFESKLGADALEPLLQEPALWESAAAWHDHLAGVPQIAEDIYSWTGSSIRIDTALLPPGLHNGGDSS
jgi:hypothetical protein